MDARKPPINEPMNRVFFVDDHPALRQRFRAMFDQAPEACGEAANIPDAMELIKRRRPDLVMMDVPLRTGSGMDLIKQIKSFDDGIRILVCSVQEEAIYAERAIRAGAHDYVQKNASPAEIIHAVRSGWLGRHPQRKTTSPQ